MAEFCEMFSSLLDAYLSCRDAYKALEVVYIAAGDNPISDWTMEWARENIKLEHDRYISATYRLMRFIIASFDDDMEDDDNVGPWTQDLVDLELTANYIEMGCLGANARISDYLWHRRCFRDFKIHSIVVNPIATELARGNLTRGVSSMGQGRMESGTQHGDEAGQSKDHKTKTEGTVENNSAAPEESGA